MGIVRSIDEPTFGKQKETGEPYSRQFFNIEIKSGNIVKFVVWGDDIERIKDTLKKDHVKIDTILEIFSFSLLFFY